MNIILLFHSFVIIAKGIPVTVSLVLGSSLIGVVLSIFINLLYKNKVFKSVIPLYVEFFRGTPLFLQLFLIYYGLGQIIQYLPNLGNGLIFKIFTNSYAYALLAMTLNTSAYGSVIIKGALQSVKIGQIEAARALGFNKIQILTRIIAPQAFYYALPAYSNEIILLVKASSLASLVTVMDITGYMSRIRSETYAFYEPFIVAASYYLIINYFIILIFKRLEKKASAWLNYKEIKI